MQEQSPRSFPGDEIDLVELFRSMYRQKYLILVVTGAVALVSTVYALLATPSYEVQSMLRPVEQGSLDELSSTGLYELTPDEALGRVAAGLSSYERRLGFFRDHQELFAGLVEPGRTLEQTFEQFNRSAYSMLQPDPKKPGSLSAYVGISLTYPEGVAGVEVLNGLVAVVLAAERQRIAEDLRVLIVNRLSVLEKKIQAARAGYEVSKQAKIATLLEQDALRKAQLTDELQALRVELRARRESRIKLLDEAIQIAESLGISKPTTPSSMADVQGRGQVYRTEVNSREIPLYFMGSQALSAERQVLRERQSDDFSEPRIAAIEQELALLGHNRQVEILQRRKDEDLYLKDLAQWRQEAAQLRGVKFDSGNLQLIRVDQIALEPLSPVKPQKTLIIALGVILGLMLGVFVALLRNMLRPKSLT